MAGHPVQDSKAAIKLASNQVNVVNDIFGTGKIRRMVFESLFDIARDDGNGAQRRSQFMGRAGGQSPQGFDFFTVGAQSLSPSNFALLISQFIR